MGNKKKPKNLLLLANDKKQSYAANAGIYYNKQGFTESTQSTDILKLLNTEKTKKKQSKNITTYNDINNNDKIMPQIAKKATVNDQQDKIKQSIINNVNNNIIQDPAMPMNINYNVSVHNFVFNKSKKNRNYYNYRQYTSKIKINWKTYIDHIYCVHTRKVNISSKETYSKMGMTTTGLFSYVYYDTKASFQDVKYYKKAAVYNALIDAYKKQYKRIMVITDDVTFLNSEEYIKETFESTVKYNIVLINPKDISEDCFIIDNKAISYIMHQKIDIKDKNWYINIKSKLMMSNMLYSTSINNAICLHKIDFVFPYVDSSDPSWQEIHDKYTGENNQKNRFRSWDNLKYLFRGIEKNMPFINNVIMLVMQNSQVPAWLNKNNVRIVTHDQFIYKKYLPTFSSCEIESFLWNVPDMSEYFIYGNDDTFILKPCSPLDFFQNGMPCVAVSKFGRYGGDENFTACCVRSYNLGIKEFKDSVEPNIFIRPNHGINPLLKSACMHVYEYNKKEIDSSITMFRSNKDFNQYMYMDYLWALNDCKLQNTLCTQYIGIKNSISSVNAVQLMKSNKFDIMCINDCLEGNDLTPMDAVNAQFEKMFGKKSKFEI